MGARWTVLEPNPEMVHVKDFHDTLLGEVEDIYLLNSSLSHFDLLVHKNSRLAKKGNLNFMELNPEVLNTKKDSTSNVNETKTNDNSKDDVQTSKDQHETVDKIKGKVKDPIHHPLHEHIHCHRENETCLDKKNHEDEINELKVELEKYKAALREEVEKRTKAEDMLKTMETIQQIEKENSESSLKSCSECDFLCESEDEMEKHTEKHREIQIEKPVEIAQRKDKCELCNKEYLNKFQLKRHMWRSHVEVECNNCEKSLSSRHQLRLHQVNEQKMTKVRECKYFSEGRCVDADECLYNHGFEENSLPLIMQSNEIEITTHDCNKCAFACTKEEDLQNHVKISHSKDKCNKCPKEYGKKFELKRHIWRSHEQVECNLCDEKLPSRHSLKCHKEK